MENTVSNGHNVPQGNSYQWSFQEIPLFKLSSILCPHHLLRILFYSQRKLLIRNAYSRMKLVSPLASVSCLQTFLLCLFKIASGSAGILKTTPDLDQYVMTTIARVSEVEAILSKRVSILPSDGFDII